MEVEAEVEATEEVELSEAKYELEETEVLQEEEVLEEAELSEINYEPEETEVSQEAELSEINYEPEETEVSQEVELSEINYETEETEVPHEAELSEINYVLDEAEVSQEGGETIILRAEDLESGPSLTNPRIKKKQYPQRYRHEWESLDFNEGWLTVSNVLFFFIASMTFP